MTDEKPEYELIAFWQDHEAGIQPPTLEQVRRHAEAFQHRTRLWNIWAYAGGLLTAVLWARILLLGRPSALQGFGEILIIAASLCWLYLVRKGRAARSVPESVGLNACMDFYRAELVRQRDFLLRSWRYFLLPIPGFVVLEINTALRSPNISPSQHIVFFAFLALSAGLVMAARRRQAARLQREIDVLSSTHK
jgi:hypothetical protein